MPSKRKYSEAREMAERFKDNKLSPEPRLLLKTQAAAYCGVCLSVFDQACPVQPIKLLDRISRYDRKALDEWIDSLTESPSDDPYNLAGMWNARNEC